MAKRSRTSGANPWPKPESERIRIGRQWRDCPEVVLANPDIVNRRIKETWDDYDSLFYNQWLSVSMQPMHIADQHALRELGIYDEVTRLLERSGLGRITTTHHNLYPDLVCQFFATLRFFFPPDAEHTGGNGTLTFMIEGVRYRLSIRDVCGIYGFPSERDNVIIPPAFSEMKGFWRLFGAGEFSGNKVSHTDIRHPVLRYMICLLSNAVLYRNKPGKVRHAELLALYYLISEDITWQSHGDLLRDLNWGAVLVEQLLEQKNTPFTLKAGTLFRVGSLITPIMRFCGIDCERYGAISMPCSMDNMHMVSATWIGSDHQWLTRNDFRSQFQVFLPLPELADIRVGSDGLYFLPSQPQPVVSRRTTRRVSSTRRGSSSASAAAGFSSSACRFTPPPQVDMDPVQRWIVTSIQTLWDAFADLSRYGCVRPRSPTSPPASPPPASSPGLDDDFAEIDAYGDD
ncbi:hypothetical protein AALP_AA8G126500 [Arabis alpina]|uniref:Arabidopsis retrotransposon Orf1 C-terminal domain-containing protein n=1 Tax=Arabis alpina TaxID=50452 RepID=A0A087G6M3_ARAAL|nr:hypothetical protein AALP_AA8G126500 [Arabis alpina]